MLIWKRNALKVSCRFTFLLFRLPTCRPLQTRCFKPFLFTLQWNRHSHNARASETRHELFIVVMCNVLSSKKAALQMFLAYWRASTNTASQQHYEFIVKKKKKRICLLCWAVSFFSPPLWNQRKIKSVFLEMFYSWARIKPFKWRYYFFALVFGNVVFL